MSVNGRTVLRVEDDDADRDPSRSSGTPSTVRSPNFDAGRNVDSGSANAVGNMDRRPSRSDPPDSRAPSGCDFNAFHELQLLGRKP